MSEEEERARIGVMVDRLMGRDGDPLLATGTREMWVSLALGVRAEAFEAGHTKAVAEKTVFATEAHVQCMNELRALNAKLARVEAAISSAVATIDTYPVPNDDQPVRAYIIAVGRAAETLRAALADSVEKT